MPIFHSSSRFVFLTLFIQVAMLAALSGCSTGSSRSDSSGAKKGSDPFAGSDDDDGKPASAQQTPMAEARETHGLESKYKALSQAVRSGSEGAVVSEASKILGSSGGDATALNALAMFNYKKGRLGAARLLLEKALEKSPMNASLLNNLALIQMSEDDTATALMTLKKAYRLDENNPEILGNLGSLYVQGGDYSKAANLLEPAYRRNNNNLAIANNYAISLRATKDYDRAARVYEELVKSNPRDVAIHLNYAILLIEFMNRPKDGLPYAIKVKFLESDNKEILDRANALEKKARTEIK